jgi:threonine/homoserine/homoserine lactone efflux protein
MLPIALGFMLGFVGSIPPAGPISILVLHDALRGQRGSALCVAIGGAIAETGWCALAFWGVSSLLQRAQALTTTARIIASVLLLAAGIVAIAGAKHGRDSGKSAPKGDHRRTRAGKLMFGLLLAGFNPTLLVSWCTVAAALHSFAGATCDLRLVPVGVPFGIVGWFLVVVTVIGRLGPRLHQRFVDTAGWVLGVALVALSLYGLLSIA